MFRGVHAQMILNSRGRTAKGCSCQRRSRPSFPKTKKKAQRHKSRKCGLERLTGAWLREDGSLEGPLFSFRKMGGGGYSSSFLAGFDGLGVKTSGCRGKR